MSTIAHPHLDYECARCNRHAVDWLDRYLQPGEDCHPFCDCEAPLTRLEVTTYQAECDTCGMVVDDYDGFESMGPTVDGMWEMLPDWHHTPAGDFCETCGPQEVEP